MNWKKSTLILTILLVFSGPALAWQTFTLIGFDDVVRVEISADYPSTHPAMDNIVFSEASMGFEGVVPDDEGSEGVTPYVESGYQLDSDGPHAVFGKDSGVNSNGTAIFGWCGDCGGQVLLTLTEVDDASFDLISLDAAPLAFIDGPNISPYEDYTLEITGYFADGSSISTTVLVKGLNSEPPVPVPVNSPLMMLMLFLVLLGGAVWTFRRLS